MKKNTLVELNIEKQNLFNNIKTLLNEARSSVVRNVNSTMVYTYFEIGRMIIEDEQQGNYRAEYGKKVLKELSEKLTKEFGRGFSFVNLSQMRQFYLIYSDRQIIQTVSEQLQISNNQNNTIHQTVSDELQVVEKYETLSRISLPNFTLSWSHYLLLMRIENPDERRFYEIESYQNNWSLRELQRQFDSALYERLALSRDKEGVKQLSEKGQIIEKPEDVLKTPCVLEFLGLPEKPQYSESDLEQKLIDKLETFMLELGKGFTFVGRQVRFTFDEQHFRVDLVFYNRFLQSFVLIDLKIGKLTHQDLGQMQMYVNYYDRFVRLEHENKTIGIILCKSKSDTLVEITLPEDNKQIFATKWQTILPSKEDLKRLIEK